MKRIKHIDQTVSGSFRTYLNEGLWLELLGVSGFSE